MERMADHATEAYRGLVQHDDRFVPYFRTVTPEQELAKLPLHMRRDEVCETTGIPYRLRIALNGEGVEETLIRGAGTRLLTSAYSREAELEALTDYAARHGIAETLLPWDVPFVSERLREQEYDYDSEAFREQLLEAVHGVAFDGYDRSVDSHVKNIRRKIEPDPRRPTLVLTVYGVGYKFADG